MKILFASLFFSVFSFGNVFAHDSRVSCVDFEEPIRTMGSRFTGRLTEFRISAHDGLHLAAFGDWAVGYGNKGEIEKMENTRETIAEDLECRFGKDNIVSYCFRKNPDKRKYPFNYEVRLSRVKAEITTIPSLTEAEVTETSSRFSHFLLQIRIPGLRSILNFLTNKTQSSVWSAEHRFERCAYSPPQ